MFKITVITPSVRKEGLKILEKSLKKQTFKDFEWLIGSPFNPEIKGAVWVVDDFKGGAWTLNRIYNKLLKKAKGELIVSYQDYIWITPLGLEKFWVAYKKTGGCITGVGHIYSDLDELGKPVNRVWTDPRVRDDQGSFYECYPQDWELNWCCAPRKAFFDIGGFDEEMDKFYGMDNVDIARRLDKAGYKFYIDQTNECRGLKHERPKDWNEKHWLFNGYKERGLRAKLDFLS